VGCHQSAVYGRRPPSTPPAVPGPQLESDAGAAHRDGGARGDVHHRQDRQDADVDERPTPRSPVARSLGPHRPVINQRQAEQRARLTTTLKKARPSVIATRLSTTDQRIAATASTCQTVRLPV
jgi:hypothetical protein